jgi:hypothetical protein
MKLIDVSEVLIASIITVMKLIDVSEILTASIFSISDDSDDGESKHF